MGLDFTVVPPFAGALLTGALWTIAITVSAAILSFFGGIVFAVIALYAPLVIRLPFRLFAWLFIGHAAAAAAVPDLFRPDPDRRRPAGLRPPASSGWVCIFAVYNSDIIQAGIRAGRCRPVRGGSRTLGLSRIQTLRKVVVPQAIPLGGACRLATT